jgi:acyl-CoA synthetase (AMP-forming)/AMP-acid ligase II
VRDRIRRFIEEGGDFEATALALWAWQVARSPTYASLCDAPPTCIEEIPAVPVALFQSLAFTTFSAEPGALFRTSGTTGSVRGVVRLQDTTIYDLGAWRHFRARVGDVPGSVVSLCPTDADSSLGHMVGTFAARLGTLTPLFEQGVPLDAWERIPDGPIWLAATAFALDAFFQLEGARRLDPRSLVMVTGGFKGRRVRLDAPSLYRAIADRLGNPRVVGEYGMTELSSQLWTDPVPAGELPGAFVAPPWMRVYTVDAATGLPASPGILRFVDLANVDSVLAIETMDLGVVEGQRVTLHGRLAGAELRGCSLRAEDLLGRAR